MRASPGGRVLERAQPLGRGGASARTSPSATGGCGPPTSLSTTESASAAESCWIPAGVGSGWGILTSKIVRGGQVVWGTPARPLKEYLAQLANLARLPATLKELRQELSDLKRRLSRLEPA